MDAHFRSVIFTLSCYNNELIFHLKESICHQMLGEEADMRYGEHRLWASVGWGLMAAVSGYLVDLDSQACQFLE